ncbi:ExeM/NucH family extracellular endonuclease [Nocardioides sp. cx-169]|uniref:ExeM/NucH family extracellular endonuclease n=1 Tax=Nocardioides sp. cx-169 TaxID=2899080 RepID=UPI001E4218E3|nr:ExeM/NucH family extracellular endonuclease [Nocardioides sp. cx-169]MCD4535584.1 ExeM/NucH family extracellular endonuclease [Nocardioides sp. cx-169]
MSSSRQRLATALGLTIAATGLSVITLPAAHAAPEDLVISEVYGGGGNSGATLTNDFIELYNPTTAPIDVSGWSVQWRSAGSTGAASGVTPLNGSVPAGKHYLVQQGAGTGGTTPLPTPDVTGVIAMGGTGGTAILSNGTAPVDPGVNSLAANAAIIDLVGVNGNVWEGTGKAPAMSNATSSSRNAAGADTDNNIADFTSGAPTPVNAAGEVPDPAQDVTASIAEIQGTGSTSPYSGDNATTTGVVTARYPTGGLGGFFLQTGGTGGAADATPGASDGIFVFTPALGESMPAVGDSVQVRGKVVEFGGLTELTQVSATVPVTVTPVADLPGVTPLATALPATEAEREAHEGELLAPTGPFTVTNAYTINQYAEIGLAAGSTPLRQPTDVAAPNTPEADAVEADNAGRAVALDDGASIDFLDIDNNNDGVEERDNLQIPLPWLTPTKSIRVGAQAAINAPVVLDYRNSTWKFQPQQRVVGDGSDVATFSDTRSANLAPQAVGGNVKLATFNVLNYFNTTGAAFEARGGTCTYYGDRDNDPVAVNSCTPNGPRGAAEPGDLTRQQNKIVKAINTLDADVVSLEEIENSVKLLGETNRDDAVAQLVKALNTAAGARRWAYPPSPAAEQLPALAEQDVIRNAFIYDPTVLAPVGAAKVLVGSAPFANAREPLAQAFKPVGSTDADAFGVIVNHFKSKGSSGATGDNVDTGDGQGAYNGDRVRQAQALVDFAGSFAQERGIDEIFLTGDFNSYSFEQPMEVLKNAGYEIVGSSTAGEYSYSFDGLSGSLDHVLANTAARTMVTGADQWEINANEPVAFQYSRFNYNPTRFFNGNDPFAASDHNPKLVGLDVATTGTEVQILATNDYHGRLLANGAEGGAAVLSGAVKQLEQENPDTVFAAAGDLIGASTFESFIQEDEPTIDALNEAGLDVSAAGNHEFDQGYDDLVGRVQDRAEWEYLAANVDASDGREELAETWVEDFGDVRVGFVGAVTEDLLTLVTPSRMAGVSVTDVVAATNRAAAQLRSGADPVDLVVLLVHEGAKSPALADATDDSAFGRIVNGVSPDVDAIVSGHTHLAYNHSVPVPAWATQGRAVTERPVVSAGQYGTNLNQLKFQFDQDGRLVAKAQSILPLATDADGSGPGTAFTANYPVDPATKAIVDEAATQAETLGARSLGQIGGRFDRAKLADGTTENRGGESALGNLVAEVQRWATDTPEAGEAQIAFMNPGGLRADMSGSGSGAFPRTLTYKQAAVVQPFANTLVNMDLTGADIKAVLEQQWQPAGSSRPFLKLGASSGFEYTYDPAKPQGSRITSMSLDGEPIISTATYSVTANSFLAAGGDNFGAFNNGTNKRDTGKADLQAMVDFMAEFADEAPRPVDYRQHAVGVSFPSGAPAEYDAGDAVAFDVSSWSFTGPSDVKDAEVVVTWGETQLGTFPLDHTPVAASDEAGKATVSVRLPASVGSGAQALTLTGASTGTEVEVPIAVADDTPPAPVKVTPTIKVKHFPAKVVRGKTRAKVRVTITAPGGKPTGVVKIRGTRKGVITVRLVDGVAKVKLPVWRTVGRKRLTIVYRGDSRVKAGTVRHIIRVVRR